MELNSCFINLKPSVAEAIGGFCFPPSLSLPSPRRSPFAALHKFSLIFCFHKFVKIKNYLRPHLINLEAAGAVDFRVIFASREGSIAVYVTDETWQKAPKSDRTKVISTQVSKLRTNVGILVRMITCSLLFRQREFHEIRNASAATLNRPTVSFRLPC